jgi:hypothetical protein
VLDEVAKYFKRSAMQFTAVNYTHKWSSISEATSRISVLYLALVLQI